MKKLGTLLISGEMFFVIFLVSGYFKTAFHLPFDLTIVFLGLSILTFSKRFILKPSVNRQMVAPFILYTSLLVLFMLSMFWTSSTLYSLDKLVRFSFITGWAFLGGLLLITDKQSAKKFLFSLILISTVGSVFTLYLFLTSGIEGGFISISGENYIGSARLSGLGAMMLLIYYFYGAHKGLSFLLLGINAGALLATGARMPLLAFIIIFMLMTLRGIRLKKGVLHYTENTKYIVVMLLMFIGAAVVIINLGLFETTISRLETLFSSVNGGDSAYGRIQRYQAALELFKSQPLVGGGLGSFPLHYVSMDVRDYPHNILLEILSETGLIGLFLFSASLYIALARFFRVNKQHKYNTLYVSMLIGFLYIFLNALISGDINDNRLVFTFIALCSMLPVISAGNCDEQLENSPQ